MSYLASKLKHKISIKKGVDAPITSGGFSRTYETVARVWAWKKRIGNYLMAIRAVNTEKSNSNAPTDTDEFGVRYCAIKNIGKAFSSGFSTGMDSSEDLYPIKADYYVFLEYKNSNTGRLYKINRVIRDDNYKEFAILKCIEVEEQGLGAPT
jgi:hypothetical protein